MKYVKRKEIMLFIDTTPTSSPTWKLVGNGMTTGAYTYDATEESETYIINDNATTLVEQYNVSLDGEMKCIYGDDVYNYINGLRFDLATGTDAEQHVLLIDKYDEITSNKFKAQVFDSSISISSYGGDGGTTPVIGFKINLNGTPDNGSATITGGIPSFTSDASV